MLVLMRSWFARARFYMVGLDLPGFTRAIVDISVPHHGLCRLHLVISFTHVHAGFRDHDGSFPHNPGRRTVRSFIFPYLYDGLGCGRCVRNLLHDPFRRKRKAALVHLQCQMRCYLARRELDRRVVLAAEWTRVRCVMNVIHMLLCVVRDA